MTTVNLHEAKEFTLLTLLLASRQLLRIALTHKNHATTIERPIQSR